MLRDGQSIGVIALLRNQVRPFAPAEIGLLQTFADQAVIAIDNARLFNETQEALEQQTATAEILQVISASPTDDPAGVRRRSCAAAAAALRRQIGDVVRYDGEQLHLVAFHGTTDCGRPCATRFPMPPDRGSVAGRVRSPSKASRARRRPARRAEFREARRLSRRLRSKLGVPMLRDGEVIGSIGVGCAPPGAVPAKVRSSCCRRSPTRR